MNYLQATKKVFVSPPAALLDNTSAATTVIDTKGFDYVSIDCLIGATDIAVTALKVQESDTLSGSDLENGADIVGTRVGTDANLAGSTSSLPSATDDNKIVTFEIDCRAGRKRYLDLVATVGGYFAAIATLSKAEAAPTTATEKGALLVMRV
jgi:hypothetical protein